MGIILIVISVILFIVDWVILMFSQGTKYTPGPGLQKISLALGIIGVILLFFDI